MDMMIEKELIRVVNLNEVDIAKFIDHHAGCIVLTQDYKILLQQRSHHWRTFPDCLATFGGHMEAGETPIQGLIRELNEELGAQVQPSDVISLGAITEVITEYSELIYMYFWHDKQGTITGCYECEAKYYDDYASALKHPKIMDDVRWALNECHARKLL